MTISTCGLVCDECEHFGTNCNGCKAVKGQTFWALEMMPTKTCPLYDCAVNQKNIAIAAHVPNCHAIHSSP